MYPLFDLTPMTGKEAAEQRTVVIGTVELNYRLFLVSLIAIVPTFLATIVVVASIGSLGIFTLPIVLAINAYFFYYRSQTGLRLRSYQSFWDKQKAPVDKFFICGVEITPSQNHVLNLVQNTVKRTEPVVEEAAAESADELWGDWDEGESLETAATDVAVDASDVRVDELVGASAPVGYADVPAAPVPTEPAPTYASPWASDDLAQSGWATAPASAVADTVEAFAAEEEADTSVLFDDSSDVSSAGPGELDLHSQNGTTRFDAAAARLAAMGQAGGGAGKQSKPTPTAKKPAKSPTRGLAGRLRGRGTESAEPEPIRGKKPAQRPREEPASPAETAAQPRTTAPARQMPEQPEIRMPGRRSAQAAPGQPDAVSAAIWGPPPPGPVPVGASAPPSSPPAAAVATETAEDSFDHDLLLGDHEPDQKGGAW